MKISEAFYRRRYKDWIMNKGYLNTDKEIWRKIPGDYYSPSIHVTEFGGIGINVGGHVLVAPVEKWYEAGVEHFTVPDPNDLITNRSTLTTKARRLWDKLKRCSSLCGKRTLR